ATMRRHTGSDRRSVRAMAVTAANWMSAVQGKQLFALMIPGTHDSGTEAFVGLSRTQYYKIDEQLVNGVRFLDMRVAWNPAEGNFHVVHAADEVSYLNFDTVVTWCSEFLKSNPTETIVMSIKQEGLAWSVGKGLSDAAMATTLNTWNAAHVQKGDWPD